MTLAEAKKAIESAGRVSYRTKEPSGAVTLHCVRDDESPARMGKPVGTFHHYKDITVPAEIASQI